MTAVYLLHKNKVLLLYRQGGRVVNNVWVASAGGHFEEGELNAPKHCVLRELEEELGIVEKDLSNLKMRYVTLRRTNDEIRQNYYFFAELVDEKILNLTSNEGILQWFDVAEINVLEMPYTAKYVIEHYLNIGMNNSRLYCGVADGKQVTFIELPAY